VSSYRGTADRPDKAKAIAAVVAIHAALAFAILSGLDVRNVRQAVERITTIAVNEPPPPPPIQARKPAQKPQAMKKPEGAAAKQGQPTPIVAPQPKLSVPSPILAAKVAGAGNSATSRAAQAGTGAGGSGTGVGADYSRFTPARLIRNLNRGDYRAIAGGRMPAGRAMVTLRVEPSGEPTNCQILRSSGDPNVDAGLCPLITQRLRFAPALDDHGRPIAFQLDYVATWTL
jgi:protein TonB